MEWRGRDGWQVTESIRLNLLFCQHIIAYVQSDVHLKVLSIFASQKHAYIIFTSLNPLLYGKTGVSFYAASSGPKSPELCIVNKL